MSHCNCFDLLKIPTISEENEILVNIVAPHSLQLSRGNFTPDWFLWWPIGTKHFPESKTLPRIQKHFSESKNTSQNPKTLPRIQNHFPESKTIPRILNHFTLYNTSQNPKHLPESKNTFQNPKHFPHCKTLPRIQNTLHTTKHFPEHRLRNRCLSSFFKNERQLFRIPSLNSVRMALKSAQETSRRHIWGKKTLFQMRLLIAHFVSR